MTDGTPMVGGNNSIAEISHHIGMEEQLSVKWKSYLKLVNSY